MSSSNYCFLTCIQVSQEAGKVVWYSHLFKNFPVYCDPHSQRLSHSQWSRSRCFSGISFPFSVIQQTFRIWSLVPLLFLNPACTSGSSWFTYCWSLMEWNVAPSCPTLCDPIDCSLPGSSVHGIFQAIVLVWIAISFSSGSSRPRDRTRVSHIVDRRFTVWAIKSLLEGFWV